MSSFFQFQVQVERRHETVHLAMVYLEVSQVFILDLEQSCKVGNISFVRYQSSSKTIQAGNVVRIIKIEGSNCRICIIVAVIKKRNHILVAFSFQDN